MVIKRGDMFYADLSPVVGSEQGGIRPVLIIQNDMGNKYSPTVIAAAITSQMNKTKIHRQPQQYTRSTRTKQYTRSKNNKRRKYTKNWKYTIKSNKNYRKLSRNNTKQYGFSKLYRKL